MPTITEFANTFDVTRNTIRRWAAEFADFLSEGANPPAGERREFTPEDARVLATIAQLRNDGKELDAIAAALGAGDRAEWPPEGAKSPQSDETDQQRQTALVTQLTMKAAHLEGQLTATEGERDRLRQEVAQERDARRAAEIAAATAETRAQMLQEQVDRLQSPPAAPDAPQDAPGIWSRFVARLTGNDRQ